ncbi:MAG: bifunctional UDP-N-acetylglucosamine diphosphorylase/glucosamine-1-phosphate N-acetyltransferase GlmU [Pseudomonadota bacterium]|nr:bifunctional UDP-N-acetylglucosamine diphosphorylase/glucosamine-1-phosphate N-acetyltransferase GlmU [Gammaproteobacteria bacterium]MBU1558412.1 bifunctional UDP-N-acetylglucosamine diphosphorylase/glucosamine-1-phosphate N-acetyltransferase GlmU [Gammaproteobacteria bacterium]MBU1629072.1 bifunctional UDP-N-acetylglucosamine diphosphorylase/glucosamine-1-phosphate N-acetyltransferase GlmU [Gammaproteobacteria bacterium]MBU1927231.1 bifunctional UDP-N-acetylglucosamine diphosphorylase/glucos
MSNDSTLNVVILAAGAGTRMHSALPKVLHLLAGKTLLEHVVQAAQQMHAKKIVVVAGHQYQTVKEHLSYLPVVWIEQKELLGTAHAVMQTLSELDENDRVLVMYGDVPLISARTLAQMIQISSDVSWLTAVVDRPEGFGRILRDEKENPIAIVETKDATEAQKKIKEINAGTCVFKVADLKRWLPKLNNQNAQKEYYLTDLFGLAVKEGGSISTVSPEENDEILGVNDKLQLATVERRYQLKRAKEFMQQGLQLLDPNRFDIRGHLSFKNDVTIDVNVIVEGCVAIGAQTIIGANTVLKNVVIGDGVVIEPNCVIEDAVIGDDCRVGPFARIRPGTKLLERSKVGNFVEVKKSVIGEGSKVNHLSYIGDTTIGRDVNVGAGTITCNYDGVKKNPTIVEDEASIGAGTQLVAPVKVGKGATVGAGSTITQDVPAEKLAIARSRQVLIEGWTRPSCRYPQESSTCHPRENGDPENN